jgi:hypothetical protein
MSDSSTKTSYIVTYLPQPLHFGDERLPTQNILRPNFQTNSRNLVRKDSAASIDLDLPKSPIATAFVRLLIEPRWGKLSFIVANVAHYLGRQICR